MSSVTRDDLIPRFVVSNRAVIFAEAVVLFLLIWQGSARFFELTDVISSPVIVGTGLYELLLSGEWVPHFVASMLRIIYAFTATFIVGFVVGILVAVSDFWEEALRPYILIGLAIPGLFATIFSAMAFGISDLTPVVATILLTFPFVADMVRGGVEDVDSDLLTMAGAFNVTRPRVYRRILFPSILPEVFSGIRFSFSVAWKITVLVEVIISEVGIGFRLAWFMARFDIDGVLIWVSLFLITMVFIEYGVFRQVERYVFAYREDVKSSMRAAGQ